MNPVRTLCLALFTSLAAFAQEAHEGVYFEEESTVSDLILKGVKLKDKRDWAGALDAWQRVAADYPKAVVYSPKSGVFLPAAELCRVEIAALPAEALELYLQRYEEVARLTAEKGDWEALRKTVARYFCTAAGGHALETLGGMYADIGASDMAFRCWDDLLKLHPNPHPSPSTVARFAVLCVKLGLKDSLQPLLTKYGADTLTMRGQVSTVAAVIAAVAPANEIARRGPVSVNPDLSLTPLSGESPLPRSVKWRLKLGTDEMVNGQPEIRRGRWNGEQSVFAGLQTYPAVENGVLVVNIGRGVIALDAATGAIRWTSGFMPPPRQTDVGVELNPELWKQMDAQFWMHRYYAVVADGIVYANEYGPGKACRLMAYRLDNGCRVWQEGPRLGESPELDLSGPPRVWRDRIYVGAVSREKASETHLATFDRASGMLLWTKFLAAFETQNAPMWGGGDTQRPAFAPVTIANASFVYACTNNGALVCLGHDGEFVWATKYLPADKQVAGWWGSIPRGETWDLGPMIQIGDDILFFPTDGGHCCRVNARDGRGYKSAVASNPLKALQVVARERSRHLVALDGEVMTLIGKECKRYTMANGGKLITFAELAGPDTSYRGRALATQDKVYIPYAANARKPTLIVYSADLKTNQSLPWPVETAPGFLLLSGKTMMSVSTTEILGLSEEAPKEVPKPPEKDPKKENPGVDPGVKPDEPPPGIEVPDDPEEEHNEDPMPEVK